MISVSASNWLDRLRSSRGFPTEEAPDLDHFLSASSSGSVPTADSSRSESTQCQAPVRHRRKSAGAGETWLGEVSNVLCELFNIGECSRSLPRKRSSRKQLNPRFHGAGANKNELCSSEDLRRAKSENGLASSGDNSLNERRDTVYAADGSRFVEDGECFDLKAYSRSEVMVIDTSLPDWKFDGWVFRKKDEWKIKEKKSKSRVFRGKKRKVLVRALVAEKVDKGQLKKKRKNLDEESFLPFNVEQTQNGKHAEPSKAMVDLFAKAPQKRFPYPRPPNNFRNEGSSTVVLLKSIPPSNNINELTKLEKACHKKCPKQVKICVSK